MQTADADAWRFTSETKVVRSPAVDAKTSTNAIILIPDKKLYWISEQNLCQARRLSQSIMENYGQESQRRMTQILPESVECFYQGLVLQHKRAGNTTTVCRQTHHHFRPAGRKQIQIRFSRRRVRREKHFARFEANPLRRQSHFDFVDDLKSTLSGAFSSLQF